MKKVLFVVNWYTPLNEGVLRNGVFHYEQCMALQKYCDIRLYWPMDSTVEGLVSGVENGLFTYRSGEKTYKNKIKWLKETIQYMNSICDDYKPDIIHANVAYPAGLVCVLVALKKRIPVVLTEHAPIEQMGLNNKLKKKMREWVYTHTQKNVCVSTDSQNRLKEIFPKASFIVNYNAVIDPSTIAFDDKTYRDENCINIGIVAAFYDKEIKGYQFLIPAIKEVNERGYKTKLHICGGGEYLDYYEKLAKELEIDNKCVFYGQCNREKVYSIIAQMDYCVSSSIFECSGVSVQEEMLLGKPILVTRSGGANSLTTVDTAIVVDRGSKKALVDGIIKMNSLYKEYDTEKIIEYARSRFEISHVTKNYLDIYDEVIG